MEKEYLTIKHFKRFKTAQPFFVWNNLPTDAIDEPEDMWSFEPYDPPETSFAEIAAKTTAKVDQWLQEKLMSDKKSIVIKGSKEERIEKTKQYISGDEILINPIFEYNNAIAEPFAYDNQTKTLIFIKYSMKTKALDVLNFYWCYEIARKFVGVENVVVYMPADTYYKKGQIDLIPVNRVHLTKTSNLPYAINGKGEMKDTKIIDFVKKPITKKWFLENIDDLINKINDCKNINKINDKEFYLDVGPIATNPSKNTLLENVGFKYSGFSGKVISSKNISTFLLHDSSDESIFSNKVFNLLNDIKEPYIDKERLYEYEEIKKSKKVIWYDFEGFSSAVSPVDGFQPYHQVIFQVSVIETINNKETRLVNIVKDPLNLTNDDFYDIIEAVYSNGADAYIVYNKSYENKRMEEIIAIMEKENYPRVNEVRKMFYEIGSKTIDLMNLFMINSGNKVPPILLNDQKGSYSIKAVEKHITSNNIRVPRPIFSYKELNIQNGGMAMEKAIERNIGLIGDKEWNKLIIELKKYCENDVRAMIMVFDFIEILINKEK